RGTQLSGRVATSCQLVTRQASYLPYISRSGAQVGRGPASRDLVATSCQLVAEASKLLAVRRNQPGHFQALAPQLTPSAERGKCRRTRLKGHLRPPLGHRSPG